MRAFKESDRQDVHHAIETLIKKGFPSRFPKISISYFKLPSQGPHKAVHILWKQSQNEGSTPQQMKLVEELCNNSKSFHSREPCRKKSNINLNAWDWLKLTKLSSSVV